MSVTDSAEKVYLQRGDACGPEVCLGAIPVCLLKHLQGSNMRARGCVLVIEEVARMMQGTAQGCRTVDQGTRPWLRH
jgi:hypothetical protein